MLHAAFYLSGRFLNYNRSDDHSLANTKYMQNGFGGKCFSSKILFPG